MVKHNQNGAVSGVGISLILCAVLLVAAIGFGAWAFTSRQDYKVNSDQKVSAAVTVAKQQESTSKDKQFAETEKKPLKTYIGPEAYGSIVLNYPKTWSGVVDSTGTSGNAQVDGYFYPGVVPSLTDQNSTFAFRMQVINQSYAEALKNLSNLQQNPENPSSITPYALPKLPKIVGVQINGGLPNQKTGVMVVLPLRAGTIELWTEGSQFTGDFANNILPNLSFSP